MSIENELKNKERVIKIKTGIRIKECALSALLDKMLCRKYITGRQWVIAHERWGILCPRLPVKDIAEGLDISPAVVYYETKKVLSALDKVGLDLDSKGWKYFLFLHQLLKK
ncbi:MAG TPA: hypothetical protein VLB82_06570 [Thermodesulfobacteriota bacterium]|nr:hypothetical protein [Thermodesulfobacteriota bacterium]